MKGEDRFDRLGLSHLTTEQEVAASFTLFVGGTLLIVANLLPLLGYVDLGPASLGIVMVATSYLFMVEAVRELEEKDHFLARKLRGKSDN